MRCLKRYVAREILDPSAGLDRRPQQSLDQHRSINALAETINCLCKAEVIRRRGPWRSFEAVEFATLEWVDCFNNRRLLKPLGNIPPAEAEEHYYATLDQPAMAA
jgi:transposase InsO family protein